MSSTAGVLSAIEPSIWSSVIRNLQLPLNERHLDTDSLLQQCGISPQELEHPHTPIPLSKYLLFMESAAELAEEPLLGIQLARTSGPETLGALGFLFLSSHTLYEALNDFCRYLNLLQDATHMSFTREGNELWFRYDLYGVDDTEYRQDTEFSLALNSRLIRMFSGSQVEISGFHFRHSPSVPVTQYEHCYAAAVFLGRKPTPYVFRCNTDVTAAKCSSRTCCRYSRTTSTPISNKS